MFGRLFASSKSEDSTPKGPQQAHLRFADEGVLFSLPGHSIQEWFAAPFAFGDAGAVGAVLSQAYLDGVGVRREEDFLLPWRDVYRLKAQGADETLRMLGLPDESSLRPALSSTGSLSEPTFRVVLTHWVDEAGVPMRDPPQLEGAVIRHAGSRYLMRPPVWLLVEHLRAFHGSSAGERTPDFNERAWAQMRRYAVECQAEISNYLEKTIVVTPEKLKLEYRRSRVADDNVVEVVPTFEGAPARWLERFDSLPVQSSYSISDGALMTRVVLSDSVQTVLAEIKRMPGRRVTGARAEALIINPLSVLGEAAAEVVDAKQVEDALAEAGLTTDRFLPGIERDERGVLSAVLLFVESWSPTSPEPGNDTLRFRGADQLGAFCQRLEDRLNFGHQWCGWAGFDFELLPEAHDHLRQLRAWLSEWRNADLWKPEDLFDLSNYSERIAEIGEEKPYALPFIQRRAVELDWFVENVLFGLVVRPPGVEHNTLVKIDSDELPAIRQLIDEARANGEESVLLPGAPGHVPISDAERAIGALEAANSAVRERRFSPSEVSSPEKAGAPKIERKHLVIKSNIDQIDHAEARSELLSVPADAEPRLPLALLPQTSLKPHQLCGVAWLQHLWMYAPAACRGALLADDMGLGKTLQLLTFIARCMEDDKALPPALIIAPVALLENWKAETARFFEPGSLPILTLYGKALQDLRIPRDQLDGELTRHGITKLLRKGWVGSARVVLTTYETLRDLEFTLAAQPWSIMVCDEAQKIKNPSAMVTRAAKKQNVRFRIACTGTPVENTLLDLWCLFDFIQPGLLGALNQFQRTYKQPIEAKTEAQKAKVNELRRLIEPQTLRRTKQEVARDILPAKLEDQTCRALPMSSQQLELYWSALERMKQQRETEPAAVLQTLHHIRRICSDPHWLQPERALRMPVKQVLEESPKMRWLVHRLGELRAASRAPHGEKVIVFCEFRDLQIQLQRVIRECFDLDVYVVNGETSASMEVENSRQKLIDQFQVKPGFNVIVLSPLAVGFGVNIQAANHVIHFTRTWNPAKEDQATDRAYRIGQTRDVTVYYPSVVCKDFDSFDTVLHSLLSWKRELARDMLNASGELSASDFDEMTVSLPP